MTISLRGVFRAFLIGAVALSQMAATAKKVPWPVPWSMYTHAQHLVDVGGRRLNIICSGSGSPTVVLDAGLGAGAFAWRVVQPRIALHTRVCSYDRAGMGFSDPAGAPRDASAIVADLHALLRGARISPPYVLVGWSSGGLYTLLYADRYPKEVAGLVEVDPEPAYDVPNIAKIAPAYARDLRSRNQELEACAADVARGQCPFFQPAQYRKALHDNGCPHIAPAACAAYEAMGVQQARGSYWRDEALEAEGMAKSKAEVRSVQHSYGDLPLIVLTDSEEGDIDRGGPLSLAQQRTLWRDTEKLQQRIAGLSTAGAHFIVARSTHAIQLDRPTVVISAVDEVVDQARRNMQR